MPFPTKGRAMSNSSPLPNFLLCVTRTLWTASGEFRTNTGRFPRNILTMSPCALTDCRKSTRCTANCGRWPSKGKRPGTMGAVTGAVVVRTALHLYEA